MSLSKRCERAFSGPTRRKGQRYCEAGRVDLTETGGSRVAAHVVGSYDDYEVSVDWSQAEQGAATVHCTCPHFIGGEMCKHVWATILAGDDARATGDVGSGGPLRLSRVRPLSGSPSRAAVSKTVESPAAVVEESADDDPSSRIAAMMDAIAKGDYRRFIELKRGLPLSGGTSTGKSSKNKKPPRAKPKPPPPPPQWQQDLDQIAEINAQQSPFDSGSVDAFLESGREAWYALDANSTRDAGAIVIEVFQRERRQTGAYGKFKRLNSYRTEIRDFPESADRHVLALLRTCHDDEADARSRSYWSGYGRDSDAFVIPSEAQDVVLKAAAATGRLVVVNSPSDETLSEAAPVAWDDGPPYRLQLQFERDEGRREWVVRGDLTRGDGGPPVALGELVMSLRSGIALFPGRIARLDCWDDFGWLMRLRSQGELRVPLDAEAELRKRLRAMPSFPRLEIPAALRGEEIRVPPRGMLRVHPARAALRTLHADAAVVYDEATVSPFEPAAAIVDAEGRAVVRDVAAEKSLMRRLLELGVKLADKYDRSSHRLSLAAPHLPRIVEALTRDGWTVEAEGIRLKRPGEFKLNVSSGVEWFELDGSFDFDGETVKLPALLAAVRKGEKYVALGDGSRGMLPDEWLKRFGGLAELGESDKETLKFHPSQALLLDALLSAQDQDRVTIDARFTEIREKLRSFQGVAPAEPPASFQGTLREYQKAGLGWLHFLREYGFGGCLADDMGLGKTVQVLSMLEDRRTSGNDNGSESLGKSKNAKSKDGPAKEKRPSLAVVPKSLVFNWIDEAKRFTPDLKVLNYTGLERSAAMENPRDFDLIVTTYGTLRRDILKLKEVPFDYAILDEAQAIKNAASQSAKACRLLQADHRLAMTGTPVENHLGELWSLFEYLNPGMLGRSAAFQGLSRRGNAEDDSLKLLSRGLAPFLLRRTKKQVLTELPEKTEQTLYCELEGEQRKQYDELKDYYRAALAGKIEKDGLEKSKIQILEALLRLRQAACHPALISDDHKAVESAKFEALLEQAEEIAAEGNKALVFSQFTSLLGLLKPLLDQRGIKYEYLDGRTRDRKAKVERFQNDPKCPLFLISLKAGGHGLNLTAAEYVFILDPWWNPAVEAQAVDRAHRIGQTKPVFAYRLIARDTVEEKILELQKTKRALADAIVQADQGLLRNLTSDDLQLLLS